MSRCTWGAGEVVGDGEAVAHHLVPDLLDDVLGDEVGEGLVRIGELAADLAAEPVRGEEIDAAVEGALEIPDAGAEALAGRRGRGLDAAEVGVDGQGIVARGLLEVAARVAPAPGLAGVVVHHVGEAEHGDGAELVRALGGGLGGGVLPVGGAVEGELEEAGDGPGAIERGILVEGDGELAVVAAQADRIAVHVRGAEDGAEVLPADALHGDEVDVRAADGQVHHREAYSIGNAAREDSFLGLLAIKL